MKWLIAGLVAGYAYARYAEGEALGIPSDMLWRPDSLHIPVSQLPAHLGRGPMPPKFAPPQLLPQPVAQVVNAALAPLYPFGFAGAEDDDR